MSTANDVMARYATLPKWQLAEGAILLDLLDRGWSSWVNRRVESIKFGDHQSLIRNVSIDLTLPSTQVSTRRTAGSKAPVQLLPLAVMRKRPLRNFSLADHRGGALPMLVADENARVAMAIMIEVARVEIPSLRSIDVPIPVAQDFWLIARGRHRLAESTWASIGETRTNSYNELVWRDAMMRSDAVLAFTYDCARHFLVLAPVEMDPGERRVIKLTYEERLTPARPPLLAQAAQRARARLRKRRAHVEAKAEKRKVERRVGEIAANGSAGGGVGYLIVKVSKVRGRRTRFPMEGLRVRFTIPNAGVQAEWTDRSGQVVARVPAGASCEIVADRPPGLLGAPGPKPVVVTAESHQRIEIAFQEIAAEHASGDGRPGRDALLTVARNLGMSRHSVLLPASSVKQTGTWHMDAESPDGVIVTNAQLVTNTVEEESNGELRFVKSREAAERPGIQRAHLHMSNVDRDDKPQLKLSLLPRPSTIAAPTCLVSALTAILLGVVASSVEDVGPNGGSLATVLLFVTGPLSAYLGRPLEHGMTAMLAGAMRMVAVASGVAGVAGAMLVLLARDWELEDGRLVPQGVDDWLPVALRGLSWFAVACAAVAGAAWFKSTWVTRRIEAMDDPESWA